MTILQNPTFQGTPHNEVRPGSGVRGSTVRRWLRDQAAVYEGITGKPVPHAPSIAATPHVHDGTNGAIIRIPLAHGAFTVGLPRRQSILFDAGTYYEGFYPFEWRPFYVPKGITQVAVMVLMRRLETFETLRCTIQNELLGVIDQQTRETGVTRLPWQQPPGDLQVGCWFMTVTPGAVNVLKLEAWDGYYQPGAVLADAPVGVPLPENRGVSGWAVVPVERAPQRIPAATRPSFADDVRVKTPSTFTSFDDHLVQNGRALPSYVLVKALQNDALLYERLTGRPAGARSAPTLEGHDHRGAGDEFGVDIDHALGSWGYGTLRAPPVGASVAYSSADVPGSYDNIWTAPCAVQLSMANSSPSTDYTLFQHRVRIPELDASHLANGTGKLKFAALVYDAGVGATIKASMGDAEATSWDTVGSAAASGTGREVLVIEGLECSRPREINSLRIQVRYSSKKDKAFGLYGTCLYYEA